MPYNFKDYLEIFKKTSYIDLDTIKKSKVFFLGIDPSISNTGLVILNNEGTLCAAFNFKKIFVSIYKSKALRENTLLRIYKMDDILRNVLQLVKHGKLYIGIEGYSYASVGRLAQLGELCGSYKLIALSWDVESLVIPPNNVKKYATGHGLAEKTDIMRRAAVELTLYNIDKLVMTSDVCDAYFIAAITYGVNTNNIIGKSSIGEDLYVTRYNIIEQGKSGGFNGKKRKSDTKSV